MRFSDSLRSPKYSALYRTASLCLQLVITEIMSKLTLSVSENVVKLIFLSTAAAVAIETKHG